ncbi:hypothetical protein HNP55_002003 [Paucibacter oligotrophus]|uniref:Lipoprotein n=1 Tax=Roseateles oligotrophus TaxID=1769250 RepID=A0A840L4L2_9BURK|nr:Ig-like domain-containing protein [Roseateles oligotrophus]MBB4843484.1 hypothetical protein [Roseateles oligotrophus]
MKISSVQAGVCLSLVYSGLLTACGGGSGSNAAPPPSPVSTASATDDAYTLDWNAAKRLGVQENDKSSGGSASISILEAPKSGTASVDGASVLYTPNNGFFGADSLKYRLTAGGVSSDATVKLSVEASLVIKGVVSDGSSAYARVVATLGSKSISTDADSQGAYSLPLKSADPTEFLSLKATALGVQNQTVLSSLAGELGNLSKRSKAGLLTDSQAPALRLSSLSTAQTALLARRGPLPSTDKMLVEQVQKIGGSELLDGASAIRMVIDKGYSLPSGAQSTLDLLQANSKFMDIIGAQRNINPALFDQMRANLSQDAGLKNPPPVPDSSPRTLVYTQGQGPGAATAFQFTLQADGSVQILGDFAAAGKWKLDGSNLEVTLDSPNVSSALSYDRDAKGQQWQIDTVVTGFRLADWGAATGLTSAAMLARLGYTLEQGGSKAGLRQKLDDSAFIWRRYELGSANHFSAADFEPGTAWVGPYISHPSDPYKTPQDIIKFMGSNTATIERSQQAINWLLVDGALELNLPDSNYRYRRLGTGPLGEERWLMEQRVAGKSLALKEIMAVKSSLVSISFDQLLRPWVGNLVAPIGDAIIYELRADGSASISVQSTQDRQSTPNFNRTWRLLAGNKIEIRRGRKNTIGNCDAFAEDPNNPNPACQTVQRRIFQLVGQQAGSYFVLEEGPYSGSPVVIPAEADRTFRLMAITDPSSIK